MNRWLLMLLLALLTAAPMANACTPGEDVVIKGQGSCEIRCHCSWAGMLRCVPYKC
jgi:hypothetical protein